jgi:ubiquinone/menaquinone biosynthesis C-methylase UbiE
LSTPEHDIERWSGLFAAFYSLVWRNPASNRVVIEHAGVGPGDRVLDIGCGPGAALESAARSGAEVYGVDPSPSMVARAGRRVPEATVVEGSAESLPFPDATFSHVLAISTFHHWASPEAGLDEVRRVLLPGGRFLNVERRLKAGKDGHGLDPAGAEVVSQQLADNGFRDCTVETLLAKRLEYLVVSGSV